jgi:proliferating cell nuclear antigen PCNA
MDGTDMDMDNIVFYARTVQANAIKVLLDSIKEVIDETVIYVDESGFKIVQMDCSHSVLVHVRLDADSFTLFECPEPTTISLDIRYMQKMIKTIANKDTLVLMVTKDQTDALQIIVENEERNKKVTSKLRLANFQERRMDIPPENYVSVVRIKSNEFQRYCRDLSNIADDVLIKVDDDMFSLKASGDIGEQVIELGENEDAISFEKRSDNMIEAKYDLKFLTLFARSSNLCSEVQILMKKDRPLILLYRIGDIGELKYVLAEKVEVDTFD